MLASCEEAQPEPTSNPGINKRLHNIISEPIVVDADIYQSFQDTYNQIEEETNLDIDVMTSDQISEAARYLGYFWQEGKAIELYETALQKPEYETSLIFHHNLGRLYDEVGETDMAIARYMFLVERGHKNYLRDIERIEKRKNK